MSASKISRMETGNRGLAPADIGVLLDLYGVPEREREELLEMLADAEPEPAWPLRSPRVPVSLRNLARLESRARTVSDCLPQVVPELAQTPEYAAEVIGVLRPDLSVAQVDQLVAVRVSRQVRLRHLDVHYLAVVDEVALRRPVGGLVVMRRQLRHLADLSERPNVELRWCRCRPGSTSGWMVRSRC